MRTPVAPRLNAPIVLVHGLMGFDALRIVGRSLFNYFPGIPAFFEASGNRVFSVRLSPTAGIAHRAIEFRDHFRHEIPNEPVHIIAHSMGGLDSRYMLSKLDMGDRVLSLTTIGTPHRGSPFADWGVRHFERFAKPLLSALKIPHQAFYDLTTESCAAFNAETPDVPNVRYHSVAGQCSGGWLSLEWRLPHFIISRKEGANDGMVSVTSATYGSSNEVWDGDHMSLVNWPNPQACTLGLWRNRFRHFAELLGRLEPV
jgi:triacylglycerol lipase